MKNSVHLILKRDLQHSQPYNNRLSLILEKPDLKLRVNLRKLTNSPSTNSRKSLLRRVDGKKVQVLNKQVWSNYKQKFITSYINYNTDFNI